MLQHFKPKSEFSRNVLTLMSGATIAQAIPIAISPILTRIYTPEDFGVFALYIAIITVFISIASLRYELAIPLPSDNDNDNATNVLVLSLIIVSIWVFFLGIVGIFYGKNIIILFNVDLDINYVWLIPISVFFISVYNIFNYWAIRIKEFKTISETKIKQSFVTSAIQLIGFTFGAKALILGQVIGRSMGIVNLFIRVRQTLHFKKVNIYDLKRVMKRYKKFPLYSSWGALFSSLNEHLPIILLTYFGFVEIAGFFLLIQKVIVSPISIISRSITESMHKNFVVYKEEKIIGLKIVTLIKQLIHFSILPAMYLMLFGPFIINLLFGKVWEESGVLLVYLVPYIAITFIFSPMSTIVSVMEWQKYGLIYQVLTFFTSLVSLMYGLLYLNPYEAILCYIMARSSLIIIYRMYMLTFLKISLLPIVKIFFLNLIIALCFSGIIYNISDNIVKLWVFILSLAVYIYLNKGNQ